MKSLFILAVLAGAGYFGWQAGGGLDTDALGVAVGIVLGALAAVPTALFVMAGSRRRERDENGPRASSSHSRRVKGDMIPYGRADGYGYGNDDWYEHGHAQNYGGNQPPVIVLAGGGTQGAAGHSAFGLPAHGVGAWGAPRSERRFKMVGEQEAWIDEW